MNDNKPIATFVTLNIGLQSETLGTIDPVDAEQALWEMGLDVQGDRIETARHEFGEEKTLIALVAFVGLPDDLVARVYRASVILGQDCIAYAYVQNGALIGGLAGPEVEKWGTFNAAYFLPYDDAIDGESIAQAIANDNQRTAQAA